jgi:hypothetical protein
LHHQRIEDDGRDVRIPLGSQAHQQPQIMDERLKAACRQPPARLLVDRGLGRKVVGSKRQGASARTIQRQTREQIIRRNEE